MVVVPIFLPGARISSSNLDSRAPLNRRLQMLDIAMIAMGVVMFVLLLGYAPLCNKLM